MSFQSKIIDGQQSSLSDLESHRTTIDSSAYSNDEMLLPVRSSFSPAVERRGSYANLDDYVVDYCPVPVRGCRRTYRISSSGCKINLGAPLPVTYVFVQGKDSACIVARSPLKQEKEKLPVFRDLERILSSLADHCFEDFEWCSENFISEKRGDLENFAVVSVRLSPREIRQEIEFKKGSGSISMKEVINLLKEPSCATLYEQSAVGMLEFKLANDAPFPFVETIQAAISAIQCLYQVLFQDDEIEVYAVGEAGRIKKFLAREEIGWHLAAINKRLST